MNDNTIEGRIDEANSGDMGWALIAMHKVGTRDSFKPEHFGYRRTISPFHKREKHTLTRTVQ
jgi:hypothetical protein